MVSLLLMEEIHESAESSPPASDLQHCFLPGSSTRQPRQHRVTHYREDVMLNTWCTSLCVYIGRAVKTCWWSDCRKLWMASPSLSSCHPPFEGGLNLFVKACTPASFASFNAAISVCDEGGQGSWHDCPYHIAVVDWIFLFASMPEYLAPSETNDAHPDCCRWMLSQPRNNLAFQQLASYLHGQATSSKIIVSIPLATWIYYIPF